MSTNETRPEVTTFRLSPQQEQQWATSAGAPGVVRAAIELPGSLVPDEIREALSRLVERHEILRTTFVRQAGMRTPGQFVHDKLEPVWRLDTRAADRSLDDLLAEEAAQPIVVDAGPPLRARLLSASGGQPHLLLLTVSLSCADVASMDVIASELATLISDLDAASEPLQYADYAEWRRELVAENDAAAVEGRAFWEGQAVEPSPHVLFADEAAASGIVRRLVVPLAAEAVAQGAAAYRTTPTVFLQASWHACLARTTGADEVVAGFVAGGRGHDELRDALGPYAQLLPIRTSAGSDRSLAELVDQVARARAQFERWQDYAEAPLLEAVANSVRVGFSDREQSAVDGVRVVQALGNPARLVFELRLAGREVELHYDVGAVSRQDAEQLARQLAAVAESAAADAEATVGTVSVVSADEREALSAAARKPLAPQPTALVHELFEQQARLVPDNHAVVADDGAMTYRELDERASRLANHLRGLGVAAGSAVGLCMDRSAAMVEALLAILKAGGAYVPLNYEHPAERLAHQLGETEAVALVTQEALLDRLPDFEGPLVCVDRDRAEIDAQPPVAPPAAASTDDRVYVMYTSGSTGLPKGVEVTHRNLASYVAGLLEVLEPAGSDERLSFAVVSAISTDLGNTSLFGSLLSGGTLHLVPPETAMDGARFAAYMTENEIDVLKITPSQLRALLAGTDPAAVLPRRWLVLGGEQLRWDVVDPLLALGRCRILNHYGPTETTVGAAAYEVVAGGPRASATVPIGRALPNSRVSVVDDRLQPAPPGVPGEILIGGHGVGRGYVAQPEQTAQVFVPDPFGEPGESAYRTGDQGRTLRDGAIEFLGRRDDQLKIRGYRVEPGEIEETLRRHPSIRDVAVAARAAEDGEPALVAYVVSSAAPPAEELQTFLRSTLPAYLVPSRFVPIDTLPLTASGKVDRARLPEPGASTRATKYVAPRTDVERSLAAIWEELLGVEQVGVNDDFFALGGHSLLATQVVIRIRRAFVDIPLHTVFESPTVAALAAAIEREQMQAPAEAARG